MVETAEPCPNGGQADGDGLVADGDGVPVDRQLDQGLQVRHVLACEEALSGPDLRQSGVVAAGSPQQK